jgi:hypothetical protein
MLRTIDVAISLDASGCRSSLKLLRLVSVKRTILCVWRA